MMDMHKYDKTEAIEQLLDDCDLIIASLDAQIALKNLRIQFAESKMKLRRPPNVKIFGYLRIMKFKKAILDSELKKLTYRHYQDVLHEKLNDVKEGKQ